MLLHGSHLLVLSPELRSRDPSLCLPEYLPHSSSAWFHSAFFLMCILFVVSTHASHLKLEACPHLLAPAFVILVSNQHGMFLGTHLSWINSAPGLRISVPQEFLLSHSQTGGLRPHAFSLILYTLCLCLHSPMRFCLDRQHKHLRWGRWGTCGPTQVCAAANTRRGPGIQT